MIQNFFPSPLTCPDYVGMNVAQEKENALRMASLFKKIAPKSQIPQQ